MENTNSQAVIVDVPDIETKNIQILPLPEIKEIANKEEQKVQDYIPLEYRTQLVSHRGFRDIKTQMTDVFGYHQGSLSTTLDIISCYLKGQKILYLEAKAYCEFYLYRMMMPAIFISSVASVISGIYNDNSTAAKIVSGATALNAFILSLINYFKLDAKAEAHKMTAYSFDQLISECEFTSGKILMCNDLDKEATTNNINNKDDKPEKYDLKYIQEYITEIEKKVKEIKEKNQFIIPETIRNRYPYIYNSNIFTEIKILQIDEMVLCNELKVISNYEIDYQNKIIKGERTPLNYANLQNYYLKKNAKIEEIIIHRKKILERDDDLHKEIKNEKYKKSGWIFY
jgi:hypothetical protein